MNIGKLRVTNYVLSVMYYVLGLEAGGEWVAMPNLHFTDC